MVEREYGRGGWVGIGTPQANPTVEAEMRRLLPADIEPLTTRLTSASDDSQTRWTQYIERMEDYLTAFDVLDLDAFGFACTGSSYIVGAAEEARIIEAAAAKFGYPIVTSAHAVLRSLASIGASRIAILAPYPQKLTDASGAYWEAAGLTVADVKRLEIGSADTRNIYGLTGSDVLAGLDGMNLNGADALLLSGTGMPTLGAISQGAKTLSIPVLSSNYCLAWALMDTIGRTVPVWQDGGPGLWL